jgi:hypothetical protein
MTPSEQQIMQQFMMDPAFALPVVNSSLFCVGINEHLNMHVQAGTGGNDNSAGNEDLSQSSSFSSYKRQRVDDFRGLVNGCGPFISQSLPPPNGQHMGGSIENGGRVVPRSESEECSSFDDLEEGGPPQE